MSLWANMTQAEGQKLANTLSAYRPLVNSIVRVIEGRKHFGKIGRVTWHGVDQFRGRRYGDSYTLAAQEAMGRYGYRVCIQTDDGERFFIPADYTMVCVTREVVGLKG